MFKRLLIIAATLLLIPLGANAKSVPASIEARLAQLEALVAELSSRLDGVTRAIDPDTGQDTLQFSDMNVQIVNGEGATESVNGRGNLIIGYNEPRENDDCPYGNHCDRRGGSHNLIIGKRHNYSAFGGMVVGIYNESSGEFASVSGGLYNEASGYYSSVSGGSRRNAVGSHCWEGGTVVDC